MNIEESEYLGRRLQELYVHYGYTKLQVMQELNISEAIFDKVKNRYGIVKRKSNIAVLKIHQGLYETIEKENKILSIPKIAKKYGVCNRTINRILDRVRGNKNGKQIK